MARAKAVLPSHADRTSQPCEQRSRSRSDRRSGLSSTTRIFAASTALRIVAQDTGRISAGKCVRDTANAHAKKTGPTKARTLEGSALPRLLYAVRRHWTEAGITTGLIAAAATAGALMGFGIHFVTPLRPFNTIA